MKSILVVDDEQAFVLAIELFLKKAGFNVTTASSGEDGLITAKEAPPDLVVLEMMMPGIGGLAALKLLKALPPLKLIPVILISGARPLVRQSEYKWAEFLQKPFDPQVLLESMSPYLM